MAQYASDLMIPAKLVDQVWKKIRPLSRFLEERRLENVVILEVTVQVQFHLRHTTHYNLRHVQKHKVE